MKECKRAYALSSFNPGARLFCIHGFLIALSMLKKRGFWIFGAGINGRRVDKEDLNTNTALVLGSEGKGLRPLVKKNCDLLIKIPSC